MSVVREFMQGDRSHSDELWEKMSDLGWMSLGLSEEYGGVGLSFIDLVIVLEEMGRVLAPSSFFSTVLLAGQTLQEAASQQQKEQWLVPIAEGKLKATLAFTEPDVMWTADGVVTTAAKPDANGFLITGTKLYVPDAQEADLIICAARTDWSSDGITLFAVPFGTKGLRVTPLKIMDQTRQSYEVSFDRVQLPKSYVIGTAGKASPVLEKAIDKAMIGLCAQMVGAGQQVLDLSVQYSKSRLQFGRPIGSFQAIQHKCADMLLLIESARSAVYAAACAASEDADELPLLASIAKAYTSDALKQVAGEGIQIHGGMGYTWESDMHLYFKRAKADEFMFGDATYHRERVAKLIGL